MPQKLILIRHGETDWSRQKKYCGLTDIDLNQKGIARAKKTALEIKNEKIYKIYSSDSKRAYNFAKLIFKNMPIENLTSLREINFGIFEGLTYAQAARKFPEIYKKWLSDPANTPIPKGESLSEMAKRIKKLLNSISTNNKNKTLALVTHAGPIKVILCQALKLPLNKIWQIEVKLGSVHKIELSNLWEKSF